METRGMENSPVRWINRRGWVSGRRVRSGPEGREISLPGGRNRNHPYGSRGAQGKSVLVSTGGKCSSGMGASRCGMNVVTSHPCCDETAVPRQPDGAPTHRYSEFPRSPDRDPSTSSGQVLHPTDQDLSVGTPALGHAAASLIACTKPVYPIQAERGDSSKGSLWPRLEANRIGGARLPRHIAASLGRSSSGGPLRENSVQKFLTSWHRVGAQGALAAQVVIVLKVAERQLAQRAVDGRAEAQAGEVGLGNATPQAVFGIEAST